MSDTALPTTPTHNHTIRSNAGYPILFAIQTPPTIRARNLAGRRRSSITLSPNMAGTEEALELLRRFSDELGNSSSILAGDEVRYTSLYAEI